MNTSEDKLRQQNETVATEERAPNRDYIDRDPEGNEHAEEHRGFFAKNPKAGLIIMAVAIVAVVGGLLFWWTSRQWENTDDAQVDGHIYDVNARVGGQILKVNVDDGQFVHAGDVLVQIDPKDYQVALAKAQADYDDAVATATAAGLSVPITSIGSSSQISSADADLLNTQAGVAAAQGQVESAQAQLIEAQANARKLNADVERYRQLMSKHEIAQQQFDQAVTAAEGANATVNARQADVNAAQDQVRQAQARVAQSQANLANARITPKQIAITKAKADSAVAQEEQKKAALEQARLNVQYSTIVSPVDGVIGRRAAQVGQNVQPGQDLFAIVPINDIWITANFKETQLGLMHPGQYVEIKIDTYGGRTWKGHVTSMGGATGSRYSLLPPENATGNYVKVVQRIPVRIDFDDAKQADFNKDGLLRPGMSVAPKVKIRGAQ